MTGFQRLCVVTCVLVFGLIVVGGVVRATDSGLGCPDWPRCHGSFIPRTDQATLIEYSHRATATVTGLFGLAVLIAAWRKHRDVPAIFYPTCLGFVLGLTQAGLGGAVVLNELPAGIVAVHLAMAFSILALLLLLTTTAFALNGRLASVDASRALRRFAAVAGVGVLVLALVGSYATGAGYSLACSGWPLCNGEVVPSQDVTSVQVIFLHRVLALFVGLTLVGVVILALRSRSTFVQNLSILALAVYVVQAIVGAANIWTELNSAIQALHLALAAALWLCLVLLNIRVYALHDVLPRASSNRATSKMAGVAR